MLDRVILSCFSSCSGLCIGVILVCVLKFAFICGLLEDSNIWQLARTSNAPPPPQNGVMKMSQLVGGGSNGNTSNMPPAPPSKALGAKQKQQKQQQQEKKQEQQSSTETKEPFVEKGLLFRDDNDPDGWKTIAQHAADEEAANKVEKPATKKEKGEPVAKRQPKKTRKMLQGLAFGK